MFAAHKDQNIGGRAAAGLAQYSAAYAKMKGKGLL